MDIDTLMSERWTHEEMCREKDRRLTEDLQLLGPRPAWWRLDARRRYDQSVQRLKRAHNSDLCTMLATRDPQHRAVMAHLIGWKRPEGATPTLP